MSLIKLLLIKEKKRNIFYFSHFFKFSRNLFFCSLKLRDYWMD